MFTCVICGKHKHNISMSHKYSGRCKSCRRKRLIPIASAAEMVFISGGFIHTNLKLLRRIYRSLRVAGVDRQTFVSMVFMYSQSRIEQEMSKTYNNKIM